MFSQNEILAKLRTVHETIPVEQMLDGFWVLWFAEGTLVVACGFDRLVRREFELTFRGVTYFDLPARWDSEQVPAERLLRLAEHDEFHAAHPDFDANDRHVFAFDLFFFPPGRAAYHLTFFVVASDVSVEACLAGNDAPGGSYRDPLEHEPFPRRRNRVGSG